MNSTNSNKVTWFNIYMYAKKKRSSKGGTGEMCFTYVEDWRFISTQNFRLNRHKKQIQNTFSFSPFESSHNSENKSTAPLKLF